MSYKSAVASITRREMQSASAPAPAYAADGKKTGLAYGLLYVAAVFGFAVAVDKGTFKKLGKGRR